MWYSKRRCSDSDTFVLVLDYIQPSVVHTRSSAALDIYPILAPTHIYSDISVYPANFLAQPHPTPIYQSDNIPDQKVHGSRCKRPHQACKPTSKSDFTRRHRYGNGKNGNMFTTQSPTDTNLAYIHMHITQFSSSVAMIGIPYVSCQFRHRWTTYFWGTGAMAI